MGTGGHYRLLAKRNQAEWRAAVAWLCSQAPRPHLFPEGEARTVLSPQRASPLQLLPLVRHQWQVPPGRENGSHWRRDVTLGEDACLVATGQLPFVFAALNNCVLALVDFLHLPNLAAATRFFNTLPATALELLLRPLQDRRLFV